MKALLTLILAFSLLSTAFSQSESEETSFSENRNFEFNQVIAFGLTYVVMGSVIHTQSKNDKSVGYIFAPLLVIGGAFVAIRAIKQKSALNDEQAVLEIEKSLKHFSTISKEQLSSNSLVIDLHFNYTASLIDCEECNDSQRANLLAEIITTFSSQEPSEENLEYVLSDDNTEFNQNIAWNIFELKQFLN